MNNGIYGWPRPLPGRTAAMRGACGQGPQAFGHEAGFGSRSPYGWPLGSKFETTGSYLVSKPTVSIGPLLDWMGTTTWPPYWWGGILGPDGLIYMVPHRGQWMYRWNPSPASATVTTDSAGFSRYRQLMYIDDPYMTSIGTTYQAYWWRGGTYDPATRKMVFIPYNANEILVLDFSRIYNVGVGGGAAKFQNGVPRIYGVPITHDQASAMSWNGACLANGRIYGAPCDSSYILCFDPKTDQVTYIPHPAPGGWSSQNYAGCVQAPNGFVYFPPLRARYILVLDPERNSLRSVYNAAWAGNDKWGVPCIGPDGMVYAPPWSWDANYQLLKIDPWRDTWTTVGSTPASSTSTPYFASALTGPDGCIYCIPYNGDDVASIGQFLVRHDIPSGRTDKLQVFNQFSDTRFAWGMGFGVVTPYGVVFPATAGSVVPYIMHLSARWSWDECMAPERNRI